MWELSFVLSSFCTLFAASTIVFELSWTGLTIYSVCFHLSLFSSNYLHVALSCLLETARAILDLNWIDQNYPDPFAHQILQSLQNLHLNSTHHFFHHISPRLFMIWLKYDFLALIKIPQSLQSRHYHHQHRLRRYQTHQNYPTLIYYHLKSNSQFQVAKDFMNLKLVRLYLYNFLYLIFAHQMFQNYSPSLPLHFFHLNLKTSRSIHLQLVWLENQSYQIHCHFW